MFQVQKQCLQIFATFLCDLFRYWRNGIEAIESLSLSFSSITWCSNHLQFWFIGSGCLQLTFVFLVLPCLLLGYLGQAAYLLENHNDAAQAFFSSVPSKIAFNKVYEFFWICSPLVTGSLSPSFSILDILLALFIFTNLLCIKHNFFIYYNLLQALLSGQSFSLLILLLWLPVVQWQQPHFLV